MHPALMLGSAFLICVAPVIFVVMTIWIGRSFARFNERELHTRALAWLERRLRDREDLHSLNLKIRVYERLGQGSEAARWRERLRQRWAWNGRDEERR